MPAGTVPPGDRAGDDRTRRVGARRRRRPDTGDAEPAAAAPAARGRRPTVGESATTTADAFAHGWFSDDAAFRQVALWGLALAAIGIGVVPAQPPVRRNWVGALVGIVPFVVALYFFFQNVNRLLPAAL